MPPFQILVVGNFSGPALGPAANRQWAPIHVGRDNLDEVLAGMCVSLDSGGVTLPFRSLEDFHPDQIARLLPGPRIAVEAETPTRPRPALVHGAGLLDQIADAQDPLPEEISILDANDLAGFIRRASVGHVVPREEPGIREQYAAATEQMRAVLHDPRFQALESTWRGLDMLVRGWDRDSGIQVYLLDVTLPELVRNAEQICVQLQPRGPWGLLTGVYVFGQSELDAQVLARLANLANRLGAPFLAEAEVPGETAGSEAWQALRASPAAHWIGLALPRFLLRLPYGKDTSQIETFPFEEMPESQHATYLWGNPAFLCAHLIGQSFAPSGRHSGQLLRRLDGLPLHLYREDGEVVAKPCAEILTTEREAEELLEAGFMPVASMKNQDGVLVVRYQSIATPAAALAGLRRPTG